jgi:hypothetical protein
MEDVRHKKKSQESTIDALLSLNLLTDETIAQTLAENAGNGLRGSEKVLM